MNTWSKEESLQYLQEKFQAVKTAMLTTFHPRTGIRTRPIGTADVDSEGNIWFFTNEFLLIAGEISVDNTVSLTYSDPHHHTYLSILGEVSLVNDRARMEMLWTPFIKTFFPRGFDDPKLILLKINPVKAEYWDHGSGSAIVLFNLMNAA